MLVNSKNLFITGISLAVYILEAMILATIPLSGFNEIINFYTLLIIFNLIFQLITFKLCGIQFVSPVVVFLLFLYVFHFGQVVLEGRYEYDYLDYVQVYLSRDLENMISTLRISVNCINVFYLGSLFYHVKQNGKELDVVCGDELFESGERYKCKVCGIWLFIISSPFRFLLDISQLLAALLGGYAGARSALSMPGVFSTIAAFWYSSIILLYLGTRRKWIFYAGITYTVMTMLTGNRGHQITNIVVMLLVFLFASGKKIEIKAVIKYGALGMVFLVFIDAIMAFRNVGLSNALSNFNFYISESLKTNIILETIGSFGETIYTPFLVVKQMYKDIHPRLAESWIYSIATIIPDIGGITSKANHDSIFQKMLNTQNTIGGSYVGDLYYNFRSLYWVVSFLFGVFFTKLSDLFMRIFRNKNYSELLLIIPVFYNSFWWVRDSMGNIFRPIVWQICFCLVVLNLYHLSVTRTNKLRRYNE